MFKNTRFIFVKMKMRQKIRFVFGVVIPCKNF